MAETSGNRLKRRGGKALRDPYDDIFNEGSSPKRARPASGEIEPITSDIEPTSAAPSVSVEDKVVDPDPTPRPAKRKEGQVDGHVDDAPKSKKAALSAKRNVKKTVQPAQSDAQADYLQVAENKRKTAKPLDAQINKEFNEVCFSVLHD